MNKLAIRAFAGLINLIAVMGLLLFIPAGTLHYWQALSYLAVFGLSTLFITLYIYKYDKGLLQRRIKAGSGAEKVKVQKIVQAFASVCFIGLYIVSALDHRFAWSVVPDIIVIIANAMAALGFYIVFRVFRENSYTSATIVVDNQQKVITTGPYAVVRHPMYSGALLMIVASPPALDSWYGMICSLLMLVVIIFRLLNEEKYLLKNLEGYKVYLATTPYRLIPWIW